MKRHLIFQFTVALGTAVFAPHASTRDLGDTRPLTLRLAPAGGYAATLSLKH